MGGAPIARGRVADRPWGFTLAALGMGARSARLTLVAEDGKSYVIVFERGGIVDASSPLAVDSIVRIAIKSHPLSKMKTEELKYALAEAPDVDEMEVLVPALNLTPDQASALRRTLVSQRAERTFAVDVGDYEVEEHTPSPLRRDAVDVRAVIFHGAQMNLSTERMRVDLLQFGKTFRLKTSVLDELDRYGFTPAQRRVVGALRVCSSLAELEAKFREVDSRAAQAVVYALASCGALEPLDVAPLPPAPDRRAPTYIEEPIRHEHADPGGWDFDEPSEVIRAPAGSDAVPVPLDDDSMQTVPAMMDAAMLPAFPPNKATTVRPSALARHEVVALIRELTQLLDRGGDHFALLGVSVDTPIDEVHAAYVEITRNLGRERLAELDIADEGLYAQQLLAQLAIAFTVLTDRIRRSEYIATLAKAPSPSIRTR